VMESYKGQFVEWQLDYPQVFLVTERGSVLEGNEEDLTPSEQMININAWSIANSAIKSVLGHD